MRAPATRTAFPWIPLLTLTTASFVAVTSEFLPTGLLPDMARDLGVSESQVGALITIFAATVVITTAPLTALTRRYSRKSLLVIVLLVFACSNLAAALAPTYELLAGARILSGAAHGLFWTVIGPYTALLVHRSQLAKGVAVTNSGGTLAFVLGIPVGTALGHALGWRTAFFIIAAIVVVLAVIVALTLPPVKHLHEPATGEIHIPVRRDRTIPAVVVACLTVLILLTGQNVYSTYIAPWIITVGSFDEAAVAPLLFVQGVAGAGGLLLAGVLGDRYPRATLIGLMLGVTVTIAMLGAFGSAQPVLILGFVLWGLSFGGIPAIMHARVLGSASPRIRDLAAAFLTVAFNLGIGVGALLGGVLLDAWGVASLPFVQVAFWIAGLAFVGWVTVRASSSARRAGANEPASPEPA